MDAETREAHRTELAALVEEVADLREAAMDPDRDVNAEVSVSELIARVMVGQVVLAGALLDLLDEGPSGGHGLR